MKTELVEALKQLARGRVDAAETVADLLLPDNVQSPESVYAVAPVEPVVEAKPKKK